MASKTEYPRTILILGATGPSGIPGVRHALKRGHYVIVYARNPSKIPEDISKSPNLTVIAGEITPTDTTAKIFPLLPSVDTIISYLGPTSGRQDVSLYIPFYRLLIQECRTFLKLPYFIILSTISYPQPEDAFSLVRCILVSLVKIFVNTVYHEVIARSKMWEEEAQDLKWTVFRVAMLKDTPMIGDGAIAGYVAKDGWKISASREDIGAWVIKEAEEMKWVGKYPALYSTKA